MGTTPKPRACGIPAGPPAALAAMLLAAALLAGPATVAAAETAGRVISAVGTVHAIGPGGDSRTLARGDTVHVGDTLRLGERASAQLRMRDDALVDLEAGTRFAIERYAFDDDGGSAVMRFLAGALRTVTGAIGNASRDEYRMETPVATIGIRGTQYALEFCARRCTRQGAPEGLYGRVDDGTIVASNDAAAVAFTRNEYFVVTARDQAPREIVRPPQGVLAGGAIGRGERLVAGDDPLIGEGELLSSTGDTLLGATDPLLDTGGALIGGTLDTTDDLLGDGGGLLEEDGGLLEEDGGLLEEEDGDLLDTTDQLLNEED